MRDAAQGKSRRCGATCILYLVSCISPADGCHLALVLLVPVVHNFELFAVFVQLFGDFHILLAVGKHLLHQTLAIPANGLQAISGLAQAQRGHGHRVQRDAEADTAGKMVHQVQGWQILIGRIHVRAQNLIVEFQDVEAHDELCRLQLLHKRFDPALRIAMVGGSGRGVGDCGRQPQLANVGASADFIERALSFQVKVDDVDGDILPLAQMLGVHNQVVARTVKVGHGEVALVAKALVEAARPRIFWRAARFGDEQSPTGGA